MGFVITARPGDWVEAGEPLATIFARDRAGISSGRGALRTAIVIADEAEPPLPLISHRVTSAGARSTERSERSVGLVLPSAASEGGSAGPTMGLTPGTLAVII